MPGPRRLIDTAMTLVWTLLVCAVVFASLRQFALGQRAAAGGHLASAGLAWIGVVLVRLCAMLCVIGLVVRARRWWSARSAESVRRRRLEAAQTLVGAPERIGAPRSSGSEPRVSSRKAARNPGRRR